jgi:hypothetical protein
MSLKHTEEDIIAWIKSLKERVQPQLQQECSEEDDYNLQCCIAKVQNDIDNGRIGRNRELLTWLKSLKERMQYQPHWKPNEEQLEAVKRASNGSRAIAGDDYLIMESLYNDLKKLREE